MVAKVLEKVVTREINCKVRSIELNVMQRCSSHLSSKRDITEAEKIGGAAVKTALDVISGIMMTFSRVANQPYNMRIDYVDVSKVANKVKCFPTEWIAANGHVVKQKTIDYCLPLIQCEQNIRIKNGIPQHFIFPCALPRETAKNKT